jgi:hypothetical protein
MLPGRLMGPMPLQHKILRLRQDQEPDLPQPHPLPNLSHQATQPTRNTDPGSSLRHTSSSESDQPWGTPAAHGGRQMLVHRRVREAKGPTGTVRVVNTAGEAEADASGEARATQGTAAVRSIHAHEEAKREERDR